MQSKNEIILYQPNEAVEVEVLLENETVWLSLNQIVILFNRDKSVISRHIKNVFKEGELLQNSVVANFATTASDGKTYYVDYYNLDVIISVGYRVKSQRGTQFRIWANRILKDYLLKGYVVNQRIDRLERKIEEHDQKFDLLIKTPHQPKEGIFCEGQIFDAYVLAADLIKSAKKSVVLIDNYVDETVLLLLAKRKTNVKAEIYTRHISAHLQLDITRHNAQYEAIQIQEKPNFHDRFLIIDNTVYHIGASFKDLGKKLFAFAKMEVKARQLLKMLEDKYE
ncbi:MAG: virulence RhuM family protein [Bacteroidetes bacterium]|nr:virulence RhuM family protein [Bacteroidota bacterium]